MERFIFVTGGLRSGKSRYAINLAKGISRKVAFIATCIPQDDEMKNRIALHRRARPKYWKIIEEGKDIKAVLSKIKNRFDVVIIDCLGLLISNFLEDNMNEKNIRREISTIAKILAEAKYTSIVVSNEVGSGLVAENPLARKFQDMLGLTNQIMAKYASEVIFMQAGIPVKIKNAKLKMQNFQRGK